MVSVEVFFFSGVVVFVNSVGGFMPVLSTLNSGIFPPKANPGISILTGLDVFPASTPALIASSSVPPAALFSCAAESSADVGVLLSYSVPPGVFLTISWS